MVDGAPIGPVVLARPGAAGLPFGKNPGSLPGGGAGSGRR